MYDASLVKGNLMIAALELGIGSCWIHRAKEEFETGCFISKGVELVLYQTRIVIRKSIFFRTASQTETLEII